MVSMLFGPHAGLITLALMLIIAQRLILAQMPIIGQSLLFLVQILVQILVHSPRMSCSGRRAEPARR